MWTKTSKSSAAAEDDVQEDDVKMTMEGGASSAGDPADEDPFEKQMRLSYESSQLRAAASLVSSSLDVHNHSFIAL